MNYTGTDLEDTDMAHSPAALKRAEARRNAADARMDARIAALIEAGATPVPATPANVEAHEGRTVILNGEQGTLEVDRGTDTLGNAWNRYFLVRRTQGSQISHLVKNDTAATFLVVK